MATVNARDVSYQVDEETYVGRVAAPPGPGPFPGVLVGHEGPGLDDVQRRRAESFAEAGFVAFALDYHGARAPFADRDVMLARLGELSADPGPIRRLGRVALDVLVAEPAVDARRVAAVGYCFGATVALELARDGAALRAVVGFHPGLTPNRPDDSRNITGAVLMCVGSADPFVPVEHRVAFEQEMQAAGVDWRLNVYGGAQHSFTHPEATAAGFPGIAYDRRSDERSWRAMVDLFDEVLR